MSVSASIVCFLYRPLPSVSCIGLNCLFPVSASTVCFLYRPQLSVSCLGLYRLFPVSAYIVCFLYRPLPSVSCIGLYCLFPVSASVVCLLWKSSRNVYRHCQHHQCKMSEGRRFIPPALTSSVCIVAMVHDLFLTVIHVCCNVLRCVNGTSPRQIALYISMSQASEHP